MAGATKEDRAAVGGSTKKRAKRAAKRRQEPDNAASSSPFCHSCNLLRRLPITGSVAATIAVIEDLCDQKEGRQSASDAQAAQDQGLPGKSLEGATPSVLSVEASIQTDAGPAKLLSNWLDSIDLKPEQKNVLLQMLTYLDGRSSYARRWSEETKVWALTLFLTNRKAYSMLRELLPLPSASHLRAIVLKEYSFHEGWDPAALEKLVDEEAMCTAGFLCVDEMELRAGYVFNKRTGLVIGREAGSSLPQISLSKALSDEEETPAPVKAALVFYYHAFGERRSKTKSQLRP